MQTPWYYRTTAQDEAFEKPRRLRFAERALLRWAFVDDHQAVLDANMQTGGMLSHLDARYVVRTCGLCHSEESFYRLRDQMHHTECMLGKLSDIPWQDASFDSIFYDVGDEKLDVCSVAEMLRVLKPQGKVLLAFSLLSLPFFDFAGQIGFHGLRALMQTFEQAGFTDVSYRFTMWGHVVVLARYRREKEI